MQKDMLTLKIQDETKSMIERKGIYGREQQIGKQGGETEMTNQKLTWQAQNKDESELNGTERAERGRQ